MSINRTRRIVEAFSALDLYDDELRSIRFEPLNGSNNTTIVELALMDDSTGAEKWLVFRGCANIRQNTDFDVVADNHFALMQKVSASADRKKMKKLIVAQKRHWRTTYVRPRVRNFPVAKKLSSLRSYVLFKKIGFHGGTIELLAKSFSLASRPELARLSRAESR